MAVRKYRIPTRHGAIEGKTQSPEVQFYNLDVIIFAYDEAHLYISEKPKDSVDELALNNFERIAKEGRKYGVGLAVVRQRPTDVNRTVLSQSSNYITTIDFWDEWSKKKDKNAIDKAIVVLRRQTKG